VRERVPVNTIEQALKLARTLSQDLGKRESSTYRNFRIFMALASNKLEALAAFFIWKSRARMISELISRS